MKMNNEYHFFSELATAIKGWWQSDINLLAGMMALLVSFLGAIYRGAKSWKEYVLAPFICGLIAYSLSPVLEARKLDNPLSVAAGAVIGGLGCKFIRALTIKIIGKKLRLNDD